ncbi:MAG TPA: hypothetical protein VHW74_09200 [Mycobacteriales bacterium]|nr:hypothetical protein [Mycobacteriales bacterium]
MTAPPVYSPPPVSAPQAYSAPVTPPPAMAAPMHVPAGLPAVATAGNDGVAPPYHFVWRRLTSIDQITAASSAVLLVSLFMPWFAAGSDGFSETIGGINDHSYLAFALLTSILLVAYLAARAGWDRLPVRIPIAHAPLLLVGSVVQLLIVGIAFLSKPTGTSHHYGSWLALIAALGACLPVAIPAAQSFQSPRY